MAKYNRVLLKLSGEALAGEQGTGFHEETVAQVAGQVKALVERNVQVGIVIGGGNFWRGRSNQQMDRSRADQIGMLATVMNSLFAAEVFRTRGVKAAVMTPFSVGTMTKPFDREEALALMEEDTVVFFAGGTGHPFFSTDTGAALRAVEIGADVILLAKNIDGVYDADPRKDPEATRFDRISLAEVLQRNLQVMDQAAAILCLENKMPMSVFYLNDPDSIVHAIEDKINGTFVYI
ncbi:UMP kinase [Anaerotalea alkaliphila]|uniref:Uridylate kinase n=1 Tax=Anaerotalea alkaliphila TaxID=2662126 RepID=A0A7X5HT54_9FIRM|nr:UMP kinase [Anaerotalea alkaliphila]NDL66159.1 UMP kinase [Anaerotalea alkaliphila]